MFSKNLRYYRLKNAMTKKDLADRVHVSPMAISNYESGTRKPDMALLSTLAQVLGIRVADFLATRNENLEFCHGEFRKNTTLTATQQDYVRECVEEYLNRFMTAVELLGGEVLPVAPSIHALPLTDDDEANAKALRNHLGLAEEGPIDNLIGILENKGILVVICDLDSDRFSGMNGLVNGRPYIVLNPKMNTERNRSTIAHELTHLMFMWPENVEDKDIEKKANAIGGAFLFPKVDVIRELGIRRKAVTGDMLLTAVEYGISMMMLVTRAKCASVITEQTAKEFYIQASQIGWRKNEPTRIEKENACLFEQLVLRAINENDISIQKGAELLKMSYEEIAAKCAIPEEA